MPANGRRDSIRRLKVKIDFRDMAYFVRFEVLSVVLLKFKVYWVVILILFLITS